MTMPGHMLPHDVQDKEKTPRSFAKFKLKRIKKVNKLYIKPQIFA